MALLTVPALWSADKAASLADVIADGAHVTATTVEGAVEQILEGKLSYQQRVEERHQVQLWEDAGEGRRVRDYFLREGLPYHQAVRNARKELRERARPIARRKARAFRDSGKGREEVSVDARVLLEARATLMLWQQEPTYRSCIVSGQRYTPEYVAAHTKVFSEVDLRCKGDSELVEGQRPKATRRKDELEVDRESTPSLGVRTQKLPFDPLANDPAVTFDQILRFGRRMAGNEDWSSRNADVVAQEFFYYVHGRLCDPGDRTNKETGKRELATYNGRGYNWLRHKWNAFKGEQRGMDKLSTTYEPFEALIDAEDLQDSYSRLGGKQESSRLGGSLLEREIESRQAESRYETLRASMPRGTREALDAVHEALAADPELDASNRTKVAKATGIKRTTLNSRLVPATKMREQGREDTKLLEARFVEVAATPEDKHDVSAMPDCWRSQPRGEVGGYTDSLTHIQRA